MKNTKEKTDIFNQWLLDTNIPIDFYTQEILELMFAAYEFGAQDKENDIL